MKSELHFLVQANVPQKVSYYKSNYDPLVNAIRMNGYPHKVLDEILTGVCRRAQQEAVPIQILHNCLDNSLQGIILPEQSAGVYGFDLYDSEEYHIFSAIQPEKISAVRKELASAGSLYRKARAIHDEQEKIYIGNMDFAAADRLTEETIERLLAGKENDRTGRGTDRLFGATTVNGNINYIPEITRDITKRYFIKGRPGTGKSTFLKKIASEAIRRGFDTEIYHCSSDPKSLDLVAVRELDFCLFDSTAPHVYYPSLPGDEIIDIYEMCVTPGTDEKYAAELHALQTAYQEMLMNAAVYLKNAEKAVRRYEETLPVLRETDIAELTEDLIRRLF